MEAQKKKIPSIFWVYFSFDFLTPSLSLFFLPPSLKKKRMIDMPRELAVVTLVLLPSSHSNGTREKERQKKTCIQTGGVLYIIRQCPNPKERQLVS